MDDAELVQRLQAREPSAFHEVVERYGSRVINTCYRFVLNREDAEDISQEVFIEIYKSIGAFRGDAKLSTWIYRIAVTRSLDEIKKRNRNKRIETLGKILHIDEIADWITGGVQADKAIHEHETMKEVMKALNRLPDNQRVAFTLSKIDGYSHQEIADIMKTTVIAVESLISRAKGKVSSELKQILRNNL